MSAAETAVIPFSERGPATRTVLVGYGFWLFLLSDIVMFAALFAAYAVLSSATAGGPSGAVLFDKRNVLIETACLLMSSFTCGLGSLGVQERSRNQTILWMGITFLLGAAFLNLEIKEFAGFIAAGDGPWRSAFLSAFFALVGTHGLHVTLGLVWIIVMMTQIVTLGFVPVVRRRLTCFALFWHALDIVWVGVFTIVYLGARP